MENHSDNIPWGSGDKNWSSERSQNQKCTAFDRQVLATDNGGSGYGLRKESREHSTKSFKGPRKTIKKSAFMM